MHRTIHDVTLADVYRHDFSRRTDDLVTWTALADAVPTGPILDVACGDGRATRHLVAEGREVFGIDVDARFAVLARQAGLRAIEGPAERVYTHRIALEGARPGLAICAYSSLFLFRHEQQADVIDAMAEVCLPGALIAVEAFVPTLLESREIDQPTANPNDPSGPAWVRRTNYRVSLFERRTVIERLYGPKVNDWTMRLTETVYWRDPDQIDLLFRRAGLSDVTSSDRLVTVRGHDGSTRVVPVANGMRLAVGRR